MRVVFGVKSPKQNTKAILKESLNFIGIIIILNVWQKFSEQLTRSFDPPQGKLCGL